MAILNSSYNSFIFNFSKLFIPKGIEEKWEPYIKRMPLPYDKVIDFLNSSVQSVNFPSRNMETVLQMKKFKEKEFKNSKEPQDLFDKSITVSFKTLEGFSNYWILNEIFDNYINFNNKKLYIEDLYLRMIDQDGYILSTIKFGEVMMTGVSELNLSYSDNVPEFKTFDAYFKFNFIDIDVTTASKDIFIFNEQEDNNINPDI